MAVAFVEAVSGSGTTEGVTVALAAECDADDVVLVALMAAQTATANEIDGFGIAGVELPPEQTPTGLPVDGTAAEGALDVRVLRCRGGEQTFTVSPAVMPGVFSLVVSRFTGEAFIPPYAASRRTGSAAAPATLNNWSAADLGMAVVFLVVGGNAVIPAVPAGWTSRASASAASLSWQVATRAIAARGNQAAETWGGAVAPAWQTVVVPLYEPGLRLAPVTATAEAPGLAVRSTLGAGEASPPLPRVLRSLPPEAPPDLRQAPPLPPWRPSGGPYRPGVE